MNTKTDSPMSAALKTALEANAAANPPAEKEAAAPAAAPAPAVRVAAAKTATAAKTVSKPPAAKPVAPAAKSQEKAADASYVGNLIAAGAAGAAPVKAAPAHNLPDCLLVTPADADPMAEVVHKDNVRLEVWGSGCLSCGALIANDPDLEPLEELPKCHYSRGQKGCPAQNVQITIVGPRRRAVSQLVAARDSGDASRLIRLLTALGDKDSSFQEEVLREAGMLPVAVEPASV